MLDWIKKAAGRTHPEPLDRTRSLASRPVRNRHVQWEDDPETGGVRLRVPTRQPGGKEPLVFKGPAERRIELDEIGAEIWRRCDGDHTTEALLAWMRDRWHWSYKEAEMGLTTYLKTLARKGLVLFIADKKQP